MTDRKNTEFYKERKQLGKTIKHWRAKRELTQEELAWKADINVSYLAKIETAQVNTSIRYLIKISKGLGVKVNELIEF